VALQLTQSLGRLQVTGILRIGIQLKKQLILEKKAHNNCIVSVI